MLLTLALSLLPCPQVAAAPDTVQIAMTRGGVRLEVQEAPLAGAREVRTAHGVFHTPLDPVAVVLTSPRRAKWRQELEADPLLSLAPTIAALDADGRINELLELVPILEARLLEDEISAEAERRRDELLDAVEALERWGARLDPLPGDLSREERIEELWKRSQRASGAACLLTGSRLFEEVVPGRALRQQLSLSDLRRGMDAKNPFLRRTVFRVSGQQMIAEPAQNTMILIASLEDEHTAARDGAADGIVRVWPGQAREYWIDVLMRWTDEYRSRAAWHLVDHLPQEAASPLIAGIAAEGERNGRRFDVGDLTLTVVSNRRRPSKIFFTSGPRPDGSGNGTAGAAAAAASSSGAGECSGGVAVTGGAGAADTGFTSGIQAGHVPRGLTNGSSAKITAVTPALRDAVRRALATLVDDREERDREAWIAWYEEHLESLLAQQES